MRSILLNAIHSAPPALDWNRRASAPGFQARESLRIPKAGSSDAFAGQSRRLFLVTWTGAKNTAPQGKSCSRRYCPICFLANFLANSMTHFPAMTENITTIVTFVKQFLPIWLVLSGLLSAARQTTLIKVLLK